MKKFQMFLFVVVVGVVLSGCMKVETTANIDETGETSVSMNIDMSQMAVLGEEADSSEDFCMENDMSEQVHEKYQNVTCKKIDDYVWQMSYTTDMSPYIMQSENEGIYLIDIQSLLKDSQEDVSQESSYQTEEEKQNSLAIATSMGFEVTMNINFPGNIVSSDIGTIAGKTLNIDLLVEGEDIDQKKEIWVKFGKSTDGEVDDADLQKIEYKKIVERLERRLTQARGANKMKRIDRMISLANTKNLEKILDAFQNSKGRDSMKRYREAKIWLELDAR